MAELAIIQVDALLRLVALVDRLRVEAMRQGVRSGVRPR